MNKNSHLIWLDLEMTGLDLPKDVILEIATIVTDGDLNIVAQGPNLVIHQPEEILVNMEQWPREQHTKSGLLAQVRASTITVQQAEEQTLQFLRQYCEPKQSPLCGNSIWSDRAFLQAYMPRLVHFTHYRMIDVTSVKEIVVRWYPHNPMLEFEKRDEHRALSDTQESIEELRHYKQYFFVEE